MSERSDVRRDLIQRLFAVAISVGFATSLIGMPWIPAKRWPQGEEINQLCILAVGMLATVLSWDGYLVSIRIKVLDQFSRFLIDVTLVFLYLFLLATSQHELYWLPTLAVIFLLYVIWDAITIRHFYSTYVIAGPSANKATYWQIILQYVRGILGVRGYDAGPSMTLLWGIYVWFLLWVYSSSSDFGVIPACVLAGTGLAFYRADKMVKRGDGARGFSAVGRSVLVGSLILASSAWASHSTIADYLANQ